MSLALQKTEATALVLSSEVIRIAEKTSAFFDGCAKTEVQHRSYLFVAGTGLRLLEKLAPHGTFEQLKKEYLPNVPRSTQHRAMQFSEAVYFFAKGKCPTVGHLVEGDHLISGGKLSKEQEEQLCLEIEKVDKGGVVRTIQEHLKKKTKPKPETEEEVEAAAQHAHDEREKNIAAVWSNAEAALKHLLHLKDVDFVLAPPAQRLALSALCVRVNKRITEVRPTKKS